MSQVRLIAFTQPIDMEFERYGIPAMADANGTTICKRGRVETFVDRNLTRIFIWHDDTPTTTQ